MYCVVKKHTIQGLGLSLLVCQTNICHTGTPISPRSWDQVSLSVKQTFVTQALPYHPGVGTESPCLSRDQVSLSVKKPDDIHAFPYHPGVGTVSPCLSRNQPTYRHSHITKGWDQISMSVEKPAIIQALPYHPGVETESPFLSRKQLSCRHFHTTQGLRPSLLFCQETSCHAGTPIPPRG